MKRRALISVYDKTGVVQFAKALSERGWEIVSSSGTAKAIEEGEVEVVEVADLTGVPHMLGGRVKTLHPAISGGILARRELESDMADVDTHRIPLIDMVVCTLYPFEETVRSGGGLDELIEKIDIGGVTLLRAAAKNYRHVTVISDIADYDSIVEELDKEGDISVSTRQSLALKAFALTSGYDSAITAGLSSELGRDMEEQEEIPSDLPLNLKLAQPLRYGENPHQTAGLYLPSLSELPWEQLAGKPLSYNNILDLDGALRGMAMMQKDVGAVVLKHTTPCGMAVADTVGDAYDRAFECDSLSAYGGVVGVTRTVDLDSAKRIGEHFTEIVAAPDFDEKAVEYLTKRRPSLRLIKWNGGRVMPWQITGTWSGLLAQKDQLPPLPSPDSGEWIGPKRLDLWEDMLLAWKAACLSKSNAVAMVKDGAAVGIGMGFCSRVFAVEFAASQAGDKAKGAVMASDAFFPFADGLEKAAEAGIVAIIQPGGSVRDDEVKSRAEELGISMFLSGWRTFRH